LSVSLSKMRR